jgi:hypothetical protein
VHRLSDIQREQRRKLHLQRRHASKRAVGGYTTLPSILGNEKFAYAGSFFTFNNQVIGFQRESSETLQFFGSLNPTFSGSESYTAYRRLADAEFRRAAGIPE